MPKYYYAVKNGKLPGIYETWDDCKAQVSGYKNAVYKKFLNHAEAVEFIEGSELRDKTVEKIGKEEAAVYVDGSFRKEDNAYSFGCVIINYNGKIDEYREIFSENEYSSMRNVAGEIEGSLFAIKKSIEKGYKKIYIHYDYEGIRSWPLGYWKANLQGTQRYVREYIKMKDLIEIVFIKVEAHTGEKYNERADYLAKLALGLVKE